MKSILVSGTQFYLLPLGVFFMNLGFDFEPPIINFLPLGVNFNSLRVYFWPLGVDFQPMEVDLGLCE